MFKDLFKGLASLLLAAALSVPVFAEVMQGKNDHYRSRQAVQAGEVMPLKSILEIVEKDHPGQVMAISLEQRHAHAANSAKGEPLWVYRIRVLTDKGSLQSLHVNAKTGEPIIIKQHTRPKRPMKKMREHHAHPNR